MLSLDSLNSQQKEAVEQISGPVLILAGAGTGKTRAITYRIAYMLEKGIASEKIAAMTFTQKAAKEMAHRLKSLVSEYKMRGVSVGTFHSFCLKILRENHRFAGFKHARFTLLSTSEQLDILKRVFAENQWQTLYRPDDFLAQISFCKNNLLTVSDLKNTIKDREILEKIDDQEILAYVYEAYEKHLQLNQAIDFDDCIFKVHLLLKDNPEIKKKLGQRWQYFLVDEFQDTNLCQFSVIKELSLDHQNICVVGDDDQSIYSWRGAVFAILEKFEQSFPNTKLIKLEQNYRSTNLILNAANAVIKNNPKRKAKSLWSKNPANNPITLSCLEDPQDEARFVAQKCLSLLGEGLNPQDIAILYRANSQALPIEFALKECTLVYKTFGGQSFFERKEIKDFFAYLRILLNPQDNLALWRIINLPPRGVGLKTQEAIASLADELKMAPLLLLQNAFQRTRLGKFPEALLQFCDAVGELSKMPLSTPEDLQALGDAIIDRFGLFPYLRTQYEDPVVLSEKTQSLKHLPVWMSEMARREITQNGPESIGNFLDFLTLNQNSLKDGKEEDGPSQAINLMTIHAAKGLEFPAVFVVGLEEGLLPHLNSQDDAKAIDEERRLFYVAITRAKSKLTLSYALTRKTRYSSEERKRSRFLREVPKELLNDAGGAVVIVDPSAKKKQTLSKLAQIRASLS